MTNVSGMSNPINPHFLALLNEGMYLPQCTSKYASGIHPMPPIWDLLLAKWHWTGFWHITVVFRCKSHLSCPEY